MGMGVAVIGMIIYSWAAEAEKKSNEKTFHHAKNSLTEEEMRLLTGGIDKISLQDVEFGEDQELSHDDKI